MSLARVERLFNGEMLLPRKNLWQILDGQSSGTNLDQTPKTSESKCNNQTKPHVRLDYGVGSRIALAGAPELFQRKEVPYNTIAFLFFLLHKKKSFPFLSVDEKREEKNL
jgi:hypothetical protein